MTSRPSTEAQLQDENRSGCAQQGNNADLLRQQRTSDPQQSSRAIFVALIAQLNRHQCCGWVGQNRELALPRDRTRHRANSSVVIVINGGDGKGMLVIGALERDHSDKGSSRLSPFRAQARAVRRRGSEARRYPLPPSEM